MTILKRHRGQDAERIYSFDVTDRTFETEVLSELIAYGEEDDTGLDEYDESVPEFQPHHNDLEGPNLYVEEKTEVVNIGAAGETKEVRISAELSP